MVVARRAPDLNSLLSSNKVFLLTGEQTPGPRIGINNVKYKRISVPLMIIIIAVYIG